MFTHVKHVNQWLEHNALKLTLSALWNGYIKFREIKRNQHKGSYKKYTILYNSSTVH